MKEKVLMGVPQTKSVVEVFGRITLDSAYSRVGLHESIPKVHQRR
jgi:hypothetical protein